jgi:hypothetical protein
LVFDRCNSSLDLAILGSSLFIARLVDKQTIEYLVYVGKMLANDSGSVSDGTEDVLDQGEILDLICTRLYMSEAKLISYTGKTLLSTARQVIRGKYPEESTEFAHVDNEHILAAAGERFYLIYVPCHVYLYQIMPGFRIPWRTRQLSLELKNSCPSRTTATPDDDSNGST